MTPSPQAERTRRKYVGGVAAGYEAKRAKQEKWLAEERVLRDMMTAFRPGLAVLDCPVGTGRFIPLYEQRGYQVTGIDASPDMISQATRKVTGYYVKLRKGDIFAIDARDASFDVAVAIRIMNLISPEDMKLAVRELCRVTRLSVIMNLRIWQPGTRFRRAQKMETLHEALPDGWTIVEDREIHEPDFRMLRLCYNRGGTKDGASGDA